jgi:hypothetical protein
MYAEYIGEKRTLTVGFGQEPEVPEPPVPVVVLPPVVLPVLPPAPVDPPVPVELVLSPVGLPFELLLPQAAIVAATPNAPMPSASQTLLSCAIALIMSFQAPLSYRRI